MLVCVAAESSCCIIQEPQRSRQISGEEFGSARAVAALDEITGWASGGRGADAAVRDLARPLISLDNLDNRVC